MNNLNAEIKQAEVAYCYADREITRLLEARLLLPIGTRMHDELSLAYDAAVARRRSAGDRHNALVQQQLNARRNAAIA